jgi:hypothetical protein
LVVTLNGRDVTKIFHEDSERRSFGGPVQGLREGRNSMVTKAASASSNLDLVNYPITGRIVSGEHLNPFTCMTAESGLGEPLDADCSARRKVEYSYRSNATREGAFKPPNVDRTQAANVNALAIDTMSEWLDALKKDTAAGSVAAKVARDKPAAAKDVCWNSNGARIDEAATLDGSGVSNALYPVHRDPRLVAGAPVSDDIVKCRLKTIDAADYRVSFTASEMDELRTIFPSGVCDDSRPGANQVHLAGTYLRLPLATANQ